MHLPGPVPVGRKGPEIGPLSTGSDDFGEGRADVKEERAKKRVIMLESMFVK